MVSGMNLPSWPLTTQASSSHGNASSCAAARPWAVPAGRPLARAAAVRVASHTTCASHKLIPAPPHSNPGRRACRWGVSFDVPTCARAPGPRKQRRQHRRATATAGTRASPGASGRRRRTARAAGRAGNAPAAAAAAGTSRAAAAAAPLRRWPSGLPGCRTLRAAMAPRLWEPPGRTQHAATPGARSAARLPFCSPVLSARVPGRGGALRLSGGLHCWVQGRGK